MSECAFRRSGLDSLKPREVLRYGKLLGDDMALWFPTLGDTRLQSAEGTFCWTSQMSRNPCARQLQRHSRFMSHLKTQMPHLFCRTIDQRRMKLHKGILRATDRFALATRKPRVIAIPVHEPRATVVFIVDAKQVL